jgi:hypothetical protein
MKEWLFQHQQDHLEIVQKIAAARGVILPTYVIDPMLDQDFKGWALRHQNYHNDANAILGTDGSDLQTVEWKDQDQRESWYWLNWQEHQAWHKRLGN